MPVKFQKFFSLTINSNRERSEQFLKQNTFVTCSLRFVRSNKSEQLEFKLDKKYWNLETCGKSYKKWIYRSEKWPVHSMITVGRQTGSLPSSNAYGQKAWHWVTLLADQIQSFYI